MSTAESKSFLSSAPIIAEQRRENLTRVVLEFIDKGKGASHAAKWLRDISLYQNAISTTDREVLKRDKEYLALKSTLESGLGKNGLSQIVEQLNKISTGAKTAA